MFWVFASLLLLFAIAILTVPLWRRPASRVAEQPAEALDVLRDQRRELDDEIAAGRLTDQEREARVAELVRRVHDEGLSLAAAPSSVASPRRRLCLAVALAVLVPALALPLYFLVGTPAALDPSARKPPTASAQREFTPEQLRAGLATLKTRLETTPEDVTGWMMLGRGLLLLNDFAGSAAAFERAVALKSEDAGLFADYADALAMQRGGDFSGKPMELIQRALSVNPRLPKALALAASAEFAQNRYDSARAYWQRLLALLPPESEAATEVKAMIAQLEGRAGGAPSAAANAGATATRTAPPSSVPDGGATVSPPVSAAGQASLAPGTTAPASDGSAIAGRAITGIVRLDSSLAAKITPADTLFIFARAVEGPRMPLAILRAKASELPRQFRLDDALGMAGGLALSSVAQVRIEARVSRSGEATPRSGDLRGESVVVSPGASNVVVIIDRVLP